LPPLLGIKPGLAQALLLFIGLSISLLVHRNLTQAKKFSGAAFLPVRTGSLTDTDNS
jgi:hypothetical protein